MFSERKQQKPTLSTSSLAASPTFIPSSGETLGLHKIYDSFVEGLSLEKDKLLKFIKDKHENVGPYGPAVATYQLIRQRCFIFQILNLGNAKCKSISKDKSSIQMMSLSDYFTPELDATFGSEDDVDKDITDQFFIVLESLINVLSLQAQEEKFFNLLKTSTTGLTPQLGSELSLSSPSSANKGIERKPSTQDNEPSLNDPSSPSSSSSSTEKGQERKLSLR